MLYLLDEWMLYLVVDVASSESSDVEPSGSPDIATSG